MKSLAKYGIRLLASMLLVVGLAQNAKAIDITVDQIIANFPENLAGTVTMDVVGGQLCIVLTNTSTSAITGADALLTGIAFDMGSVSLTGGSAAINSGSTGVNTKTNPDTSLPTGTDMSGEWGYMNSPIDSGHFGGLAVSTSVSTMEADADTVFDPLAVIETPNGLNGPEFGMLKTGGDSGGLGYIENSIRIYLDLDEDVGDGVDFLNGINDGHVAITFGSPTGSVSDSAGTTLSLLGIALCGLSAASRRFMK